MKLAKADLVPTETNLIAEYGSFAELETAWRRFAYVGGAVRPGWDVLAEWAPGVPAAEYEAVGATWVIDATWPDGDWLPEFGDRVRRGPPV